MSTETNAQSGKTASQSVTAAAVESLDIQDTDTNDTQTDESNLELRLKQTSQEAKKYRQKNADLNKRLAELENEKLKAAGQWEDAYQKTKSERDSLLKEKETIQAKYAFKVVSGQIAQVATELQCVDPSALVKLMSNDGMLDELQVDDDFNVDKSSVKQLLDRAKKQFPYMWGKTAPNIKDATPKTTDTKQDISTLTLDEQIKKFVSLGR